MIAVHYTSVKTSESAGKVFGIDVAVRNWIKAWFRYGKADTFHFLIGEAKEKKDILEIAGECGLSPDRLAILDRRYVRENFPQFRTIFRLNPDSHNLLWQREQVSGDGFNFCGLAHSISGLEAGKLLEQYCLAPSVDTDAIVCPSHAVQSAIRSFWDSYGEYLQRRFGARFRCPVQLPVIPLGVDCARFEANVTPELRAAQRDMLGLAEGDIALLWVGRLSSAIKAHPLAMFQAAERAAEMTGATVRLIMVGYFMPETAEEQFRKLAQDFCVKAKVIFIASDDVRFPNGLWAAGDIFLSLVDNMQESFGLTPIEAMAAGLPRVVSDWDGYRDSVTHGEDGFLIPTVQPPQGMGEELVSQILNEKEMYGGFLAKSALSVAVDQNAAAEAIALLIRDKDRRRMLREKAKVRVQNTYDWRHIIPAYEALWEELAERRTLAAKAGVKRMVWPTPMPQVPDPFTMYEAYPSGVLNETDVLSVAATPEQIRVLWSHEINVLALDVMLLPEETTVLIGHVSRQGEISIGNVFAAFPALDRPRMWRTISWLIKLGILGRKTLLVEDRNR